MSRSRIIGSCHMCRQQTQRSCGPIALSVSHRISSSAHGKQLQQQVNIRRHASSTSTSTEPVDGSVSQIPNIPYRQRFKQEKKRLKDLTRSPAAKEAQRLQKQLQREKWELTVGIEIHAELDTERKLFSSALTSSAVTIESNDDDFDAADGLYQPNTNISLHDLAYPGAQPVFQVGTIIPAVRAALALGCRVHRKSAFDRKHYFYADQPAGYQITQFYRPFATDGEVILVAHDGVASDAESGQHDVVRVGIERVQLEQDTAKSLVSGALGETALLDFNRTSHPLIEIVSRPHLHSPSHAAAYVRKVQEMLHVVGAVTAGMESGALRADINVSVRQRAGAANAQALGQRTEIKNLSSLKAIEDAITAERDRQISVLEAGGQIHSETRGWTLGGRETTLLRRKEGEVDYRYMPDPDIPPLIISNELIEKLRETAPVMPDSIMSELQQQYDIDSIAARTLYQADNGGRLEYLAELVEQLEHSTKDEAQRSAFRKTASNYVLHEIPALITKHDEPWTPELVPISRLAELLLLLGAGRLHKYGAKTLLSKIFLNDDSARSTSVTELAQREELLIEVGAAEAASSSSSSASTTNETDALICTVAERVFEANPQMVSDVLVKKETKKINFFAGQVMRELGKMGKAKTVDPRHVSELVHDLFWDTNRKQ